MSEANYLKLFHRFKLRLKLFQNQFIILFIPVDIKFHQPLIKTIEIENVIDK